MLVEAIERLDWHIKESDTGDQRRKKSIVRYHLLPDTWYSLVQDLMFETHFADEFPNKLPFEQRMVRRENKSPKYSEYWGSVSMKEEVERLSYTSLRCKTNSEKLFCFRPWIKLHDKFRCFWSETLRAVSGDNQNESEFNSEIINYIYHYISTIIDRIPYILCVFDIGQIEESWETNSGAHLFDWKEDSDILYDEPTAIHFRDQSYQETRPLLGTSPLYRPVASNVEKPENFEIV